MNKHHKFRNNKGRKFHKRRNSAIALTEADINKDYYVVGHYNKKLLEMGFYCGAGIRLIRNLPNENNIIVAIGHSRYFINKEDAKGILISEIPKKN